MFGDLSAHITDPMRRTFCLNAAIASIRRPRHECRPSHPLTEISSALKDCTWSNLDRADARTPAQRPL